MKYFLKTLSSVKAETEYSQDLEFYHKLRSFHWIMEHTVFDIFHGANHFIVGFYLKHNILKQ